MTSPARPAPSPTPPRPGSLDRRALGCCAVALATTRTVKAAREALSGVWPADVQAAALAALRELEHDPAGAA